MQQYYQRPPDSSAKHLIFSAALLLTVLGTAPPGHAAHNGELVDHVIIISVDGLRPDATTALPEEDGNAFGRLLSSPHTLNARTIRTWTRTLPNHVSMITSRPEGGDFGHDWESNNSPDPGTTVHTNHGNYVSSIFDVAHDRGLFTALFAGKSKFNLFPVSYGAESGAPDLEGIDNGRNKIDAFMVRKDAMMLANATLDLILAGADSKTVVFLHFFHPDSAGHSVGWDLALGSQYMDSVAEVDTAINHILDTIQSSASLYNRVAVIVTSDHGGGDSEGSHGKTGEAVNYTVPLFVWFCDEQLPVDLYELNLLGRLDPGDAQIEEPPTSPQPIRAGEVGNLALDLLGLPPIPDSAYNDSQDLRVAPDGNRCAIARQCELGADCDDRDPCTTDTCDKLGRCAHVNHTGQCDDGDACTVEDQCDASGTCMGNAKDCSGLDDQCTEGRCAQGTGECFAELQPTGTRCHDGDACTLDDKCNATGTCAGDARDCSNFDNECAEGRCAQETGECFAEFRPVGTSCDDGDACTDSDACKSDGSCVGVEVNCSGLDETCRTGRCDPESGLCRAIVVEVETPCNDFNACTHSDSCDSFGVCVGRAVECAPTGAECTKSVCNPVNGTCELESVDNGTRCAPGFCMDETATCVDGQCLGQSSCDGICERCHDNLCESRCGRPVSDGKHPVASDALFTLRAAVEGSACPRCICDVNDSKSVEATDALIMLHAAVSQTTELDCPPATPVTTITESRHSVRSNPVTTSTYAVRSSSTTLPVPSTRYR